MSLPHCLVLGTLPSTSSPNKGAQPKAAHPCQCTRASQHVNLENCVADGIIDSTKWRKVSIPIADLVSPEFALDRVFIMSFVRMMGNNCFDICGESCYDNPTFYSASCDTPQDFYIDNIVLKAF